MTENIFRQYLVIMILIIIIIIDKASHHKTLTKEVNNMAKNTKAKTVKTEKIR